MSRRAHRHTEEDRLPVGMTVVGYDADEETFTYRDANGTYWGTRPGNRYGDLRRVDRPLLATVPPRARPYMTRVRYDRHTRVYTYRDETDGALYETPPGLQYGTTTLELRLVAPPPPVWPPASYQEPDSGSTLGRVLRALLPWSGRRRRNWHAASRRM
ncbi:hypothetical protein VTK26DRAFT_6624 [Humicola hyalothermophila]